MLGLLIWGLSSLFGGRHTPTPASSLLAKNTNARQTEPVAIETLATRGALLTAMTETQQVLENLSAKTGTALAANSASKTAAEEAAATGTAHAQFMIFAGTQTAYFRENATLTAAAELSATQTTAAEKATTETATLQVTLTPLARITDKKGVPMALIPAGEFQMGSENGNSNEKPVHRVFLDAFYMDVYEVTNARYADCVSAGYCEPPKSGESSARTRYYDNPVYADYPVIYVTWEMAKMYCEWRSGSLPTEAQWEKAARGGLEQKDYPWGNQSPVCQKGALNGARFFDYPKCKDTDTTRVGSYKSNGYGLFDMAGNVWELVNDWYQIDYYLSSPGNNPTGPDSGNYKVLRGGAWHTDKGYIRVAYRFHYFQYDHYDSYYGFRCAAPLGR
jgi:formylglycine-generating enzyme required for sulfatase activity